MDTNELEVTVIIPEENESAIEPTISEIEGEPGAAAAPSDAVEIARLQSERDITIAAINAETEQTRQAAHIQQLEIETESKSEIEQCREQIAQLETRLALMENSLTPQGPLAEVIAETLTEATEELPMSTEPNLTEQSTPIPTAEIVTEVSESVEEENPEVETVENPRRRFIAI